MSTPTELWKKWEGRVVAEKFRLRQWLGASDHGAVFLTERTRTESSKAAIKLVSAENLNEDAQLSHWADAAKLSHPHLIRLFESGRCQIDGTRFLYVVMEYAEENLAEILPLRPLSADEASEMLRPAAEALTFLHQSGFAHGRIKPSNILAVHDQLKISADGLRKTGEHADARVPGAYDAPELMTAGVSPAADIWSLGVTLVAVLTQREPTLMNGKPGPVAVPETIPQPHREIARQCLQVDPKQRWTASEIVSRLQPRAVQIQPPSGGKAVEAVVVAGAPRERPKRWIVVPIVVTALFLVAWIGSRFMAHQPSIPAAQTHPASQPAAAVPATQSSAPFSTKEKPAQKGVVRGSVLQQVMPDISPSAQNTIDGRLKVGVHVSVDASGNVSEAKFVSAGPSTYFANRALAASRHWKFNPPQVDGQPAASEWVLRFQFARTSIQVFPTEMKR
jgi:TonB family protein